MMTASVVTADPATPVREVAALMRERNVGSVVLVRDGAPVGIVTDRDLALGVIADGRSGEDHALDHATAPVVTGEPGMDVSAACDLLVEPRDPPAADRRRRTPDGDRHARRPRRPQRRRRAGGEARLAGDARGAAGLLLPPARG